MSKPPPQKKPVTRAERLLAQFHEETPVGSQAVDWQMLRDLVPFAKKHKKLFGIAFALMPIGALSASLQPMLLQRAINSTGVGAGAAALGSVVALYALLVVVRFSASFAETYAMQLAG